MKLEDQENIEYFIHDRIAAALRDNLPQLGDESFVRAKYYVKQIMKFLETV